MKFEDILPFMRQGKMAQLTTRNGTALWKISNNFDDILCIDKDGFVVTEDNVGVRTTRRRLMGHEIMSDEWEIVECFED